jgi:hypothetical protein
VQPAAALKIRVRILSKGEEEYEEEMRFRRTAVPVTEGTAAGVLCLALRFCVALVDRD